MAPQASTTQHLATSNRHQLEHHKDNYNYNNDFSDQSQMPILAQAKPAIISPSDSECNDLDHATGVLSEKIKSALRLSPSSRETVKFKFDGKQMMRHIEDDSIIQKQNASNQMRQAAVMTAAAGQQKVRLSATERLALTAKRPLPSQQVPPKLTQPHQKQHQPPPTSVMQRPIPQTIHQRTAITSTSSLCNLKSAPLPTLETLLAVQRQLQQHTRQNLTSMPQKLVNNNNNNNPDLDEEKSRGHELHTASGQQKTFYDPTTNGFTARAESRLGNQDFVDQVNSIQSRARKPLPPSPTKSPAPIEPRQHVSGNMPTVETYDKDLPPLPSSISPSTNTNSDESQMNSLDSQSSPATSLVSLPPPPPPISFQLEQYDEVSNACHHQSSSSTTSTVSSISDASSVRQYVPLQVKPQHQVPKQVNPSMGAFELSKQKYLVQDSETSQDNRLNQQKSELAPDRPPAVGPKPSSLRLSYIASKLAASQPLNQKPVENQVDCNRGLLQRQILQQSHSQTANQTMGQSSMFQALQNTAQFNRVTHDPQAPRASQPQAPNFPRSSFEQEPNNPAALNYQQHNFNLSTTIRQQSSSDNLQSPQLSDGQFEPVPLPPTPMKTNMSPIIGSTIGLDQPDSGTFRFPTPPPPDLLLDDNDTDEFEARKGAVNKHSGYRGPAVGDDEDYLCKIPTPPPYQSMSVASFDEMLKGQYLCRQTNQMQAQTITQLHTNALKPPTSVAMHQQDNGLKPPALFRQQQLSASNNQMIGPPQANNLPAPNPLTVHIGNDGGGLLSTATHHHLQHHHALANRLMERGQSVDCVDGTKEAGNHGANNYNRHHHLMISSSSPSSSSDGDGHSSNSSSSTSGIHSSIDSPSSSSSKLYDFNYSLGKKLNVPDSGKRHNSMSSSSSMMNSTSALQGGVPKTQAKEQQQQQVSATPVPATNKSAPVAIRPALKQKKSVSFSDKVELVACADEQTEDHLPNPLLARVLAGKSQ